jgi:galactose mutarotase-like enzyme
MKALVIQNEFLAVSINPIGAEICSIKSLNSNTEYCWQGNPDVWASTAPVLFPIIGGLKDGYFLFEEKKYSVPKHGFIRNNKELKVITHDSNELILGYCFNEQTLIQYPFEFYFQITFELVGNKLNVKHLVSNLSNEKSMYFSLGGHPAFNCPFIEGQNYDDFYLEFEKVETLKRWQVTKDGLLGQQAIPFIENSNRINLTHELFNEDALVFKEVKSRKVSLKSVNSSCYLSVEFPDFNYLGIWAKPNGDFVCIEPWLGITDSEVSNQNFKTKEGIIELKHQSDFKAGFSIEINE